MSEKKKPPENPPEKDEDDKLKFQEYIVPLFMDFAEKNKIDPMVCYVGAAAPGGPMGHCVPFCPGGPW
jgi:hypothetical protein